MKGLGKLTMRTDTVGFAKRKTTLTSSPRCGSFVVEEVDLVSTGVYVYVTVWRDDKGYGCSLPVYPSHDIPTVKFTSDSPQRT